MSLLEIYSNILQETKQTNKDPTTIGEIIDNILYTLSTNAFFNWIGAMIILGIFLIIVGVIGIFLLVICLDLWDVLSKAYHCTNCLKREYKIFLIQMHTHCKICNTEYFDRTEYEKENNPRYLTGLPQNSKTLKVLPIKKYRELKYLRYKEIKDNTQIIGRLSKQIFDLQQNNNTKWGKEIKKIIPEETPINKLKHKKWVLQRKKEQEKKTNKNKKEFQEKNWEAFPTTYNDDEINGDIS